jgi:subtilisin family serine protease
MKRVLFVVLVVLLLSAGFSTGVSGAKPTESRVYLLVFRDEVDPERVAGSLQRQHGFELAGIYRHALKGAVIEASPGQAEEIAADERVLLVEPNQVYSVAAQTIPTGIQRVFADDNPNLHINDTEDWWVDADVAVLDTGIDFDHPDLNLHAAIDCTLSGPHEGECAGTRDDGHGHGTHVAGTIGALDNGEGVVGVAPGVRLWAVKVLTNYGTGTTAQIVAGIDYVAEHADEIEVANMSLGGTGESDVMDQAIANATNTGTGVIFALAAGNRAMDVADYHPAGHPDAITVSALADFDGEPGGLGEPTCREDTDDTLIYFSNFGEGVDVAAPGTCIYSTYMDGRYVTMSGTSMAAPHVAGAAAILAASGDYSPAQIKAELVGAGNYDWVDDSGDGFHEPLLDLSDAQIFAPRTLPADPPIQLSADGFRRSGWQYTDLTWEGADSDKIDIYRDGSWVGETGNDGVHRDDVRERGAGMHFYRICEAGAQEVCSASVMVLY